MDASSASVPDSFHAPDSVHSYASGYLHSAGRLADITQTVNSALAVVKQLGSSLGGGAAAEAQLVEQLEMLQRGLNSTRYQLGAALPEADREDVSTMLQTISGMNPRASNEEFTHMLEVFHGSLHMLNPTLSSSLRTACKCGHSSH